ncbi:S9 family peptidase [Oscillatoria laete-virens NRMC-F 0139]|nr:S9 family peptidase [Oscillatoria laete-virens]MDL5055625.1 S9 family peptidase [Oscillatoria laete-virens NRMC-F 0139]
MIEKFVPIEEKRRGLVSEDLMNFRWLDDIALSPDGKQIAYTVKQPNAEINGYITHVYVRDVRSGSVQRITSGMTSAWSPAWSRDSRQLAFTFTTSEANWVRIWTVETGETRSYIVDGAPMNSLDWSPDGRTLVGSRWTPIRPEEERGSRPGIPAPNIRIVRRLRYKQDGSGWVHDRYQQIWTLSLETGDLTQITHSECDYTSPKWSVKGDRLAFVGTAREQNVPLGYGQILICDMPGGTPRLLLPGWQGTAVSPAWGDNDRYIAFAGHNLPPPVNRRNFWQPYIADVEAGTARKLGEDIDEEVGNYAVADQRKGLANVTVKWAPNDTHIYYLLTEKGATNLFRSDTSGNYERIVSGNSVTFEYSPAAGGTVAFGQADPSNPGELYLWHKGHGSKLSDFNPWLRDHILSTPEEYWYDGVDGAKVHAWLMKPVHFKPGYKYPTIVYVHCSMFSWDFNHEFQVYANAGYVVAYFNQRGTTAGYGQAWTHASEGDQGGKDYEEIMLGVDELVARPYVDASRLGVTGGSCGGFMTNWIVGHTDRFAAAVTQRSITNQISFFGTSDIGPEGTEGETGTNVWRNLDASWRQSPIAYAEHINTPLLILHAEEDYRCALEQAEQLFAILRWLGKTVEMVVFEGENHSLTRGGRPGNRIEHQRQIYTWFGKYLGTHAVRADANT